MLGLVCLGMNIELREEVEVSEGLVVAPCLFNLYIDGFVRKINASRMNIGIKLTYGSQKGKLRMLIYADDAKPPGGYITAAMRILG